MGCGSPFALDQDHGPLSEDSQVPYTSPSPHPIYTFQPFVPTLSSASLLLNLPVSFSRLPYPTFCNNKFFSKPAPHFNSLPNYAFPSLTVHSVPTFFSFSGPTLSQSLCCFSNFRVVYLAPHISLQTQTSSPTSILPIPVPGCTCHPPVAFLFSPQFSQYFLYQSPHL